MRWTTPLQSPRVVWRNSRIVGYQGESSRSRSQRHSDASDSATKTAHPKLRPDAQARRINGHHQVQIANHGGGVHERASRFVEAIGKIDDGKIDRSDLLRSEPFLQADEPHARQSGQGRKVGERKRTGITPHRQAGALPDDADPVAVDSRELLAPLGRQRWIGPKIRDARGIVEAFVANAPGALSKGR